MLVLCIGAVQAAAKIGVVALPLAGTGVDEPVQVREAAGLRAVGHAELAVDVREVELDRLLCDPELGADRAVRGAGGDEAEHLELTRGEPRGLGRLGLGLRLGERVVDVAGHDLAHEGAEADGLRRLADRGVDARGRGLGQPALVHRGGEQDDLDVGQRARGSPRCAPARSRACPSSTITTSGSICATVPVQGRLALT